MAPVSVTSAIGNGEGGFSIETVEVGAPRRDELIVEIRAAGVCHTDVDSMSWDKPVVMGHEGAGVVRETGSDVSSLEPGDPVLLNWAIPCGDCPACLAGQKHICDRNSPVVAGNEAAGGHPGLDRTLLNGKPVERSFSLGTMSSHAVVREPAAVKLTGDVPFPQASIIGCGVMTGYGSVVKAARVEPGASMVVLGTGGVGLNVVQGGRIAGAGRIVAVDLNEHRLELSREFGATHTIQPDPEDEQLRDTAETVRDLHDGRGADYAFECTAVPNLAAAPLAMVHNAGTAVQVSGVEQEITIDMNLFEWDKVYVNPLYGKAHPEVDFPALVDLYESGELLLDEQVSRTYALEELGQAFEDMAAGEIAKGVVVFD